ncbi:MAG: pyruvate dehydrogenase complex dihydrolipoamide acetyltransferase [Bacteroidia bacterium]|nr:pyruvate dehydrogenase complex dihydrolipoamide acetyltransferase [Bacteroidia bacterium]NND25873.1 pyruvate dehydrogenase complex dihydrolipoamide acetyltransferase [Flavobacteriaceae bacterium]MBT8279815.1 pyruvate dehydrogenase complex dihydrolipoamide acetyltransferase [Bacteroidia bacterium]NNK59653.1 pyruvate dehydrogenase complex dihydrolipoamide acetyltransferase [Flavobacteriaceae bacterium]NNL32966.1 pyruvate dehydrogenase complex dihydrolipoamide acetyltransferase [Flavobacteriace
MAEVINMPRLSDTMEEGTVASWLKKVGDKIEEGDILAEIETDKATMEFESFHEGTLLHIGVKEGETTKVDTLLAIIGDEGEDVSELINGASSETPKEKDTPESDATTSEENETEAPKEEVELPEGVTVVTMPRLSDTMEEGTVASWLKKVGDNVEEGDILAEIETDKATMEFESFQSGTLLHIGLSEGESAKVDALLAIIGPKGTDVSHIAANFKAPQADESKVSEPKAEATPVKESKKPEVQKQEPVASVSTNGRLFVSPLAKKMASEKGINLSQVQGTGENGRIIKRDIESFVPGTATSTAQVAKFVASGQEDFDEVQHSQMRKVIAKRLAESKFTAPHYYLIVEFDMDNAIAFREQYNSLPDTKISYNDMIVKACALALRQHPQVNSRWYEDRMQLNNHVHIGVAVAVEDGLVVPVLKFANEQSLTQINAAVKDYAGRARNKKLTPAEMEGSTFTISNLGMFGIESFTSIINQPNSAILSVGTIVQKPVVKNGQIVVGNTMKLSMACDHRTVDGATGAQFLQTLKGYIENPVTMLV